MFVLFQPCCCSEAVAATYYGTLFAAQTSGFGKGAQEYVNRPRSREQIAFGQAVEYAYGNVR